MDPGAGPTPEQVSAAMRRWDVLEPWQSESDWDESYWDRDAAAVLSRLPARPTPAQLEAAIVEVVVETFGTTVSPKGVLRPEYRALIKRMTAELNEGMRTRRGPLEYLKAVWARWWGR